MAQDVTDVILSEVRDLRMKVDGMATKLYEANPRVLWERIDEHGHRLNGHDAKFNQQKGALALLSACSAGIGGIIAAGFEYLTKHH